MRRELEKGLKTPFKITLVSSNTSMMKGLFLLPAPDVQRNFFSIVLPGFTSKFLHFVFLCALSRFSSASSASTILTLALGQLA